MSRNSDTMRKAPPGILLLRSIRGKDWSLKSYRYLVLFITFIAYASYHASKKPSSIVKSVLYPDPTKFSRGNLWPVGNVFMKEEEFMSFHRNRTKNEGWYPFNGTDGTSKLGEIDVAFMACYFLGMYVAGHLGDTLDLRLFLTAGMIGSGIFVGLFGMGYFWNVHRLLVLPCYANVGNISGSLLATTVLDYEDIGFGGANASSLKLHFVFHDGEAQIQKETAVDVKQSSSLKQGSGSRNEIHGEFVSVKSAGNLSSLFDVGGIFGGILDGYISDKLNAWPTTAATFMFSAIPSMLLYCTYGNISRCINILLMMIAGLFVNGPYALITTAVSADLGTQFSQMEFSGIGNSDCHN
ncbi:hypothetical protein REPUB_Repub08aG0210000 [Reevesia pubescens]